MTEDSVMGFFAYSTEGLSEKKWGYSHETGFICVMLLVFLQKKIYFIGKVCVILCEQWEIFIQIEYNFFVSVLTLWYF